MVFRTSWLWLVFAWCPGASAGFSIHEAQKGDNETITVTDDSPLVVSEDELCICTANWGKVSSDPATRFKSVPTSLPSPLPCAVALLDLSDQTAEQKLLVPAGAEGAWLP